MFKLHAIIGCVIVFVTVAFSTIQAHACSTQVDNLYFNVEPQGDGVHPGNGTCLTGILTYYHPQNGWTNMGSPAPNEVVWAKDVMATSTPWGPFVVILLENGNVIFRWGDYGNGDMIINDDYHTTFYAYTLSNTLIEALDLRSVSYTQHGTLSVEIEIGGNQTCYLNSDTNGTFSWHWACYALPPGQIRARPAPDDRVSDADVNVRPSQGMTETDTNTRAPGHYEGVGDCSSITNGTSLSFRCLSKEHQSEPGYITTFEVSDALGTAPGFFFKLKDSNTADVWVSFNQGGWNYVGVWEAGRGARGPECWEPKYGMVQSQEAASMLGQTEWKFCIG